MLRLQRGLQNSRNPGLSNCRTIYVHFLGKDSRYPEVRIIGTLPCTMMALLVAFQSRKEADHGVLHTGDIMTLAATANISTANIKVSSVRCAMNLFMCGIVTRDGTIRQPCSTSICLPLLQ